MKFYDFAMTCGPVTSLGRRLEAQMIARHQQKIEPVSLLRCPNCRSVLGSTNKSELQLARRGIDYEVDDG